MNKKTGIYLALIFSMLFSSCDMQKKAESKQAFQTMEQEFVAAKKEMQASITNAHGDLDKIALASEVAIKKMNESIEKGMLKLHGDERKLTQLLRTIIVDSVTVEKNFEHAIENFNENFNVDVSTFSEKTIKKNNVLAEQHQKVCENSLAFYKDLSSNILKKLDSLNLNSITAKNFKKGLSRGLNTKIPVTIGLVEARIGYGIAGIQLSEFIGKNYSYWDGESYTQETLNDAHNKLLEKLNKQEVALNKALQRWITAQSAQR